MHYDLVIKNGIFVTGEKNFQGGVIAVKDGKINQIGRIDSADTFDTVYDACGRHILPGIIDAHVHFRDPGLTSKEDFESGSIAASFGGVTTVIDMPNTVPPTSSVKLLKEKARIAQEKSYVDFAFFALLSSACEDSIADFKKIGVPGFKVFLGSSTGDITPPPFGLLFEKMTECASSGLRIGFHCETGELNSHFTSIAKKTADKPEGILLSQARPVISEALAVQTAICYAQYTGAKIHIHHVTSSDSALLIAEAKKKGINVSAETCPHYLLLDSSMEKAHKVYPPIRDERDRAGLWNALSDRTIDMLASDHAPHGADEKNLPLWDAPAGLSGAETFACVLLNEVNKGRLSINDFVRLTSENPAKIWGIFPQKGNLLPGADADFTIVDMNMKKTIRANDLHSKSKTTPYGGLEVQGIPVATIVRGSFVMKDGELTGSKGYGRLVTSD